MNMNNVSKLSTLFLTIVIGFAVAAAMQFGAITGVELIAVGAVLVFLGSLTLVEIGVERSVLRAVAASATVAIAEPEPERIAPAA